MGDSYVWVGPISGDWGTPANWEDVTAGQDPAVVAPGSLDAVTFDSPTDLFQVITGAGSAATLTLNGDNDVAGLLNVGTLAAADEFGIFEITGGASVTAGAAVLSSEVEINGSGTKLRVDGTLTTSGFNGVLVSGGATGQANDAVIMGGGIGVDFASSFEVGTAGGAAAGSFTIDNGATLSLSDAGVNAPAFVDNGSVVIAPTSRVDLGGTLSGTGTVLVGQGGTLNFTGPIAAHSPAITLEADAVASFFAPVSSGTQIEFDGDGVVFALDTDQSNSATDPIAGFAGTITGFNQTDVLLLSAVITSAVYTAGVGNFGTLALFDAATQVGAIALAGTYSGDTFATVRTVALPEFDGVGTEIMLSEQGNGSPSPGTTSGDSYVWVGPVSGDWGTAANWQDVTVGQHPAIVAPGSRDAVTFNSQTGQFQDITGAGNAVTLTLHGNNAITGLLAVGTLAAMDVLEINGGASVTAGAATLAGEVQMYGSGTELRVNGTLNIQPGSVGLIASGGATAQANDVNVVGGKIGVFDASSFEVGTSGGAAASSIIIDNGATLSLSDGEVEGPQLVDDGSVVIAAASQGFLLGVMSGNGSIFVGQGGTVSIYGAIASNGPAMILDADAVANFWAPVGSGTQIKFNGDDVVLALDTDGTAIPATDPIAGFAGTITGFNQTDVLLVGTVVTSAVYTAGAGGVGTLALFDDAKQVGTITLAGAYSGDTFGTLNSVGAGGLAGAQTAIVLSQPALCFCPGTQIATPSGDVPIEHLAVGDLVLSRTGIARPIVWIGIGRVLATRGSRTTATPVIIRKGALADNIPHHDLHVTKAHSLYIDDVLIPVEFLVNHRSILWDDHAQEVKLYHIELETHDVLLANGAPAESYRDDGNRWLFRNANSGWDLPPKTPCAPVLTGGPVVDAAWRRLLDRAASGRHVLLTQDPDLHLMVDGKRTDAIERSDDAYVFRIRARPHDVRIRSRVAVPQELGIARDARALGVAVRQIVLAQRMRTCAIDADAPSLADGYHPFETDNGIRWTDGDAAVPVDLFVGMNGPGMLILHLGGAMQYLDDGITAKAA